ncbi:hypothetical protein GRI40_04235 [Altererythrobacter aerius]|uniref:Uncharacterized protein n=1 Tax=Tsuneonella aeria TaxID=1837929 RepID=A0A6I4TB27_9SPHN|nr:hypothetical protein [Tsuneonella aeria]MXO74432.1 hypothetical protein [Tsuneonella aeria]
MMRLHRSVPGIIALAITAPAQAGTTSGTIAVSLTVEPTCHVTARPMPFVWRAGFPSHAQTGDRTRRISRHPDRDRHVLIEKATRPCCATRRQLPYPPAMDGYVK